MSVVKIKTCDQKIRFLSLPKITSSNRNTDYINVFIDDTWTYDDLTVSVILNNYILETVLENGSYNCRIPNELESNPGKIEVSMIGKSNDEVVKTTDKIYFVVEKGIDIDSYIKPIDYKGFILNLIKELNSKFDLELQNESTFEEILTAIDGVDFDPKIKSFFIDLLNSQLSLQLGYDADDIEIVEAVSNKIDELKQGTISFSILQYYVRKISNDYVTNPSEDATPEFINYTNDIDDYMQISTNALIDLYGGE